MRIKTKMLLLLIPPIFVVLGVFGSMSYLGSVKKDEELAKSLAEAVALKNSGLMLEKIEYAEAVTRALVGTLERCRLSNIPRATIRELVFGAASASPDFFGAWVLYAADAYDGRDAEFVGDEEFGNEQGRANAYWTTEDGKLVYDVSNKYDTETYYTMPAEARRMTVLPPYRDMDTKDKVFMTSVAVPVFDNGRHIATVGIDLGLDSLNTFIKKIAPYGTGHAMLINDVGMIISAPDPTLAGQYIKDALFEHRDYLMRHIAEGVPFSRRVISPISKEDVLEMYIPVRLASFNGPWFFMVALPYAKVMEGARHDLVVMVSISLISLLFLVVLMFLVASNIAKPISKVCAYAKEVSSGKFEARLDDKGFAVELHELADSLAVMLQTLLSSMRESREKQAEADAQAAKSHTAMAEAEQARQISEADRQRAMQVATRIEAVSLRLEATATALGQNISSTGEHVRQQEALMSEAVAAVDLVTDTTTRVARSAEDAATFAARTREQAHTGARVVHDAIEGFSSISRETDAIGIQMQDLGTRTEGIGDILEIINDIADQTNLLALNAAIEAARAGEAGRGFAVVADEVRKLAEKTMQATTQVGTSVRGIQSSMATGSEGVRRASETARKTLELGNAARAPLADIVSLVQSVSDQIQGIAALCRDQSASTMQIASTVAKLNTLSGSVRSDADRLEKNTRQLEPEAKELAHLMEELNRKG